MAHFEIATTFNNEPSKRVISLMDSLHELPKEELGAVKEAISIRWDYLRGNIQDLLEKSSNRAPRYVETALLSIFDPSGNFPKADYPFSPQAISSIHHFCSYATEIKWKESIGAYEISVPEDGLPVLPEIVQAIIGKAKPNDSKITGATALIRIPYSPNRLLEKLSSTRGDLSEEDLRRLKDFFFSCEGPWCYAETPLSITKDERERILIKDPLWPGTFACFKSQSPSEFYEEQREMLKLLPRAAQDAAIYSLSSGLESITKKGMVTSIEFDELTHRLDYHLFDGSTDSVYEYQSTEEFFERTSSEKVQVSSESLSWLIDHMLFNNGQWNMRGLLTEIVEQEDGSIDLICRDETSNKLFPPSSASDFLTNNVDSNPNLDEDTKAFLRAQIDSSPQEWCKKGFIISIMGSADSGIFMQTAAGQTVGIFKSQSNDEFFQDYVDNNPFLSAVAREAITKEVRSRNDGPWRYKGLISDVTVNSELVIFKLSNGESYEIKL